MTRRSAIGIASVIIAAALATWWIRHSVNVGPRPVGGRSPLMAPAANGRRVIFIGLDGADWSLLDQYIARGTMPTLSRLVKEGTSGKLTTIHPPLSPLIWTTMLTGVSPLEHRILDFLRVNPVSEKREPITSDERQSPAVWNMATYAGKRSASLGFWATYPAEAVDGLIVSDRLFTFLYSEASPPPGVVNPSSQEGWARETLGRIEREVGYAELKALLPWLGEPSIRRRPMPSTPTAIQ